MMMMMKKKEEEEEEEEEEEAIPIQSKENKILFSFVQKHSQYLISHH